MESRAKSIWFLKSEKIGANGEPDEYQRRFAEAGWVCTFVPVLEFSYINADELKTALSRMDHYSGIILTSQRAATAIEKVAPALPALPETTVFVVVRNFVLTFDWLLKGRWIGGRYWRHRSEGFFEI